MKIRQVFGLAAIVACIGAGSAQAMDNFLIGPRAMGMAGANVASVDNNSAQYYNPAAFGFFGRTAEDGSKLETDQNNLGRKDWGFEVYGGGGYRINNDLGDYLNTLADIDLNSLTTNGITTESDLANLVNLVADLNGLDEPGNGITANVNAGASLRIKHFGLGVRGYSQATGKVLNIDNVNLGLNIPTTLGADISNTPMPTGYNSTAGDTYQFFSPSVASALAALPGFNLEIVDQLEYIAIQQNIDPALANEMASTLINVQANTDSATPNDLSKNTTAVLLSGYSVMEVPLSYGYALNDNVSVGGNFKLMKGRVYGTEVLVFDDNNDEILKSADDNYKDSTTFGLDLGVMARYGKFNFGLVGRNLNSPKFDGFNYNYIAADSSIHTVNVSGVTLKPQLATGIAYMPFETLTLEADIDLTKNETTLNGYDTQNVAAGLEWDAFRFLALRAGVQKNLAEDDIGLIYTAGLGLNLWLMRLDVAGAASLGDTAMLDGEEVPKYAQVSAQVSFDF